MPPEFEDLLDAPEPQSYGIGEPGAKKVADDLVVLASEPELAARKVQLRSLARALKEEQYSDLWRGRQLRTVFADAVTPPATGRLPRRLQLLGALRILLVFVPVGLTWWGIHLAASAYTALLAENPDLVAQSFFREWLEGFGGTLWLTFDRMAMLIAFAVGALVIVWILAERAQERHDAKIEGNLDAFNAKLEQLLTEAELHLSVATASTTDDVVGTMDKVARRIDTVASRVDRLLEKVALTAQQIREASEGMETTTDAVHRAATAATDAVGEISDAAAETVRGLDTAASGLAGSLREYQSELTDSLRQYQSRLTEEMQRHQNELETALGSIAAELNHVADQSEQHREAIGGQLGDHRDAIAEIVPRLVHELNQAVAAQLEQHGRQLVETVQPLLQAQAEAMAPSVIALAERVELIRAQTESLAAEQGYRPPPRRRWWQR